MQTTRQKIEARCTAVWAHAYLGDPGASCTADPARDAEQHHPIEAIWSPLGHGEGRGTTLRRKEADYKPAYDLRGVDVTKTKEPEGINGPVLTVNERNARIDNMLSHLYGMQMLQLRMNGVTEEKLQQLNIDYPMSEHSRALCRVGPGYKEPLDDDVAIEDDMARVDSDIESSARRHSSGAMPCATPAFPSTMTGMKQSSLLRDGACDVALERRCGMGDAAR
ncbi:hypothetical protein HAX54_013290, partial [Datura stramonium]|nr:hypothetical protein [Datura stramonium]